MSGSADGPRLCFLLLRPGAVGDTLLAVPAIRALRRHFPTARVCLAAHAGSARLLAAVGEVDQGLAFDESAVGRLLAGGVLEHPLPCPAHVVAWTSTPGRLQVSTSRGLESVLVWPARPPTEQNLHCAAHLQAALGPWGVDGELDDRPLPLAGVPHSAILVHVGSGSAKKNWPTACFAELVSILERAGEQVCLIVGEADEDAAQSLDQALGQRLTRLEGLSLLELAQRLAGCRGYVGNDSGVSHLAGLAGAPTIALFGPSNPHVWRPLGSRAQAVMWSEGPQAVAQKLWEKAGMGQARSA